MIRYCLHIPRSELEAVVGVVGLSVVVLMWAVFFFKMRDDL